MAFSTGGAVRKHPSRISIDRADITGCAVREGWGMERRPIR